MKVDLPFELFVAIRYLLARRKQAFISLISLISVLGVSVGVMALLIALALIVAVTIVCLLEISWIESEMHEPFFSGAHTSD